MTRAGSRGRSRKNERQCEIGYIPPVPTFPMSWPGIHQERITVIMKTTLAILALGSLALMTSGASAYQSRANGYQSYPNYDRQEYQNRSCCSWKTNHKAPHKVVKH
jgi:hypothetical protein